MILYDTCYITYYVSIYIFRIIHYIKICKIKLKTYKKEIMCYYSVLCFTFNGYGYVIYDSFVHILKHCE